jgi:CO/xanthine dehydrogenase Mo-binding subunit
VRLFEEASKMPRPVSMIWLGRTERFMSDIPRDLSIGQVATACYNREGSLLEEDAIALTTYIPTLRLVMRIPTGAFGTHVIEEVDRQTGQVKVLNFVAAHDVER